MKNIILLDDDSKTGLFHAFMLNLYGCSVTEIRTPSGALNRILTARHGRSPFDLLIISHFPPSYPFHRFLQMLRDAEADLPVLIIERPENPEALSPGVFSCPSDDVPEKVMEIFDAAYHKRRPAPVVNHPRSGELRS